MRAARQKSMILAHLRVAPLTVAEALNRYGIYALSQRVGELKRDGHPIEAKMIQVREGVRVAQYRLNAAVQQVSPKEHVEGNWATNPPSAAAAALGPHAQQRAAA